MLQLWATEKLRPRRRRKSWVHVDLQARQVEQTVASSWFLSSWSELQVNSCICHIPLLPNSICNRVLCEGSRVMEGHSDGRGVITYCTAGPSEAEPSHHRVLLVVDSLAHFRVTCVNMYWEYCRVTLVFRSVTFPRHVIMNIYDLKLFTCLVSFPQWWCSWAKPMKWPCILIWISPSGTNQFSPLHRLTGETE